MFIEGVVVFSGEGCSSCEQLKNTLLSKGIEFKEYDVWANTEALRFIMDKGFRTIPQLFKDGVKTDVSSL